MPIKIRDLDGGLGNLITGSGVVNNDDYLNALREHLLQDKAKFANYRYSLADWTQVTQVSVSNDTIHHIANLCRQAALVNPHPIVAVAAKSDLAYGLSRMAQLLMSETGWEHEVFRSRTDAEAWIKIRVGEKYGITNLSL